MRAIYLIFVSLLVLFFSACESENEQRSDNNSFLPDTNVDFTLELARPTNSSLRFNGGELFLSRERAIGSLEGVYIFRASASTFFAFDLAEPNHPLNTCTIEVDEERGIPNIDANARFRYNCNGEITLYDSLTGQRIDGDEQDFSLRAYTVFPEMNGDQVVRIRITG